LTKAGERRDTRQRRIRALSTPGQVAGAASNNAELAAHQSERPARPRLPNGPNFPDITGCREGRTAVSSPDNGNEFRGPAFREPLERLSVRHTRIHAGRPQTNGHVEALHKTILDECWRPAFARYLYPRYTALRRELDTYLAFYNFDRVHHGRLTRGQIPANIVYGARKMEAR
jgi:transposase InsO family protein